MELNCEFLSVRTFNSKDKQYFLATFSSAGIGSFEVFLSNEQFNKVSALKYLQSVNLIFELFANNLKLGLRLAQLSF